MTLEIVNSLDENIWREFVGSHSQANVFHTPEMFKVFSQAQGHRPSLWAAIGAEGYPMALFLPVQVTLHNGMLYPWTARAIVYGSILVTPGTEGVEGLKLLLHEYDKSMAGKLLFTELRNLANVAEFQPALNECNFTYEDHLNYVLDLDQSESKLWRGLSKSCRKDVRNSLEKGTVIEEVTSQAQLAVVYQQLMGVYARVHVPLADISLFRSAFETCYRQDMCKIFMARLNDRCIGASILLIYKGTMYAWYAGTDRAYSSYSPGELLKWHSFQWGQAHGCHRFDFGGAGKPTETYGPRAYKAKFGGALVNYGRNVCIHSPLRLTISTAIYSLARTVSSVGTIF
jgi:serine/alanine adding enzyme